VFYSFCMWSRRTVVAAASEPGRVVTNGMSQYSRNERNANGRQIVVGINAGGGYPGHPLAGNRLGAALGEHCFACWRGHLCGAAQLVGDFIAGSPSAALGEVTPSYRPVVTPTAPPSVCPTMHQTRDPRGAAVRLRTPDQGL